MGRQIEVCLGQQSLVFLRKLRLINHRVHLEKGALLRGLSETPPAIEGHILDLGHVGLELINFEVAKKRNHPEPHLLVARGAFVSTAHDQVVLDDPAVNRGIENVFVDAFD